MLSVEQLGRCLAEVQDVTLGRLAVNVVWEMGEGTWNMVHETWEKGDRRWDMEDGTLETGHGRREIGFQ